MTVLIPLFLSCMTLAIMSHLFSVKELSTGSYISKERFFWSILTVLLILFVGLRTRHNDTTAYTHAYNLLSSLDFELNDISLELGDNPGFHVTQWALIQLGFSAQSFLMFFAVLTNGIYLWFLQKYSNNLWFAFFLFFFWGGYFLTLAAIKQCIATAFALLGVDRYLEKKKLVFIFWILLGALFHPYALMYLLTPFLTFRPWNIKTGFLILIFAFIGPMLQPMLGTVIDITTLLGEEYTVESFNGSGISIFRFAVAIVPVLMSFVSQRVIADRNDKTNNLFLNFTFMQALIMYVALFGTANYFARLANYFSIFICFSLPWLITQFDRRSQRLLTVAAMAGYFLFFYYENAILRPFDSGYSAITLTQYLKSLF